MKKMISILFIATTLVGCTSATTEADKEERFTNLDRSLHITTDIETGCKYIVLIDAVGSGGAGGITPLMQADGRQDCE